jgi:hypothetical protein
VDELLRARLLRRMRAGELLSVAEIDALLAEMPEHPPLVVGDLVQDGDERVMCVVEIDERRRCRCTWNTPEGPAERVYDELALVYAMRR